MEDPRAFEAGDGSLDDIARLRSVGSRILGKSLCALGDFAVYPVARYIEKGGESSSQHGELAVAPRRRIDPGRAA